MTASVTYTGNEVAMVAGLLINALPLLNNESDYEVADLLLDKAMVGFGADLPPDLVALIAAKRASPFERFERTLLDRAPGVRVDQLYASICTGFDTVTSLTFLERMAANNRRVVRDGPDHWIVKGPNDDL